MLDKEGLGLLNEAVSIIEKMFNDMPEFASDIDISAIKQVLFSTAKRLEDNYPYPHPLYAGQMLKPPHPIARLAYTLSLWINPNNHALDGRKASSIMEKECVSNLAHMIGWEEQLVVDHSNF
jgi:tyrosine decarboxylase/aspartate 1-decarboxylase